MIVKLLMSPVVSYVPATATLSVVLTLMRENKHSCVLVAEDGVALGIITERDIVRFFFDHLREPREFVGLIPVQRIMTPDPTCVAETTTLLDALVLSRSEKLRHLPVVGTDGKLAGMVTHTDMVNAYVHLLERQEQLEGENQELQALSLEDPLLNIGNRRALEMELALAEAQSRRQQQPFSVIMFDVDWFKRYNDHYGHPMGDKALQLIVNAIKSCMRSSDRLYRYGGEELMLLTPNSDGAAGLAVADRARKTVEGQRLLHSESPLEVITVSAGVAWGLGIDSSMLINAADKALYQAKESGRNQACLADDIPV